MSSRCNNLVRLPLDIHVYIFQFLSPADIIILRKTCKTVCSATSLRIVWISAVHRMCWDNTIYRPSFHTEEMSITDLEHASMGPTRWQSLVKESISRPPSPTYTTTIGIFDELTHHEGMPKKLFLVPGGRFLVSLISGYLSLWDLGSVSAVAVEYSNPRLVGRRWVGLSECTCHPSSDGSAIKILTVPYPTFDPSKDVFNVLEISTNNLPSDFRTVASLSLVGYKGVDYTSVCEDIVAIVYGPNIKLWNTRTNKSATWYTDHVSQQILMNQDFIVLLHDEACTVWRVPELSGDVRTRPQPMLLERSESNKPLQILTYGGEISTLPDASGCSGLYDWYTGSPQPLWFDIVEEQEEALSFLRFEVTRDSDALHLSINSISKFQVDGKDGGAITPYRVCGKSVVVPWYSNTGIHCHTGHPKKTGDDQDCVTTLCAMNWSTRERVVSICPVAGRLVYLSETGRDIHVVDLFRREIQ